MHGSIILTINEGRPASQRHTAIQRLRSVRTSQPRYCRPLAQHRRRGTSPGSAYLRLRGLPAAPLYPSPAALRSVPRRPQGKCRLVQEGTGRTQCKGSEAAQTVCPRCAVHRRGLDLHLPNQPQRQPLRRPKVNEDLHGSNPNCLTEDFIVKQKA